MEHDAATRKKTASLATFYADSGGAAYGAIASGNQVLLTMAA
jgi:hypothetical protein